MNPASKAFIRRTREAWFGKPLEEIEPRGEEAVVEWAKGREGVGNDRFVVCEERGAVPTRGDGVVGGLRGGVLAYDTAESVGRG